MTAPAKFYGVVLTLNEARNIEACLEGLKRVAAEILVVDSGSTDDTVAKATALGAKVVAHPFSTHAEQWKFALSQLPRDGWTIALDADQRVTPELARSLAEVAGNAAPDVEGIYVNRLHVFRGKPLRHGGLFPKWMLKVFRSGAGFTDDRELLDFRFYVHGKTVKADGLLVEDNRNEAEIAFWIEKHNRFSTRQAREELARRNAAGAEWSVKPSLFGTPDQRILYLKSRWYRLPLYVRPFLYFNYRYWLRLGFLDGKQGFLFHFMQALWYRVLVDVKLEELLVAERRNP